MQALCVIHCLRKGRPNNWIWLIVFLPVIGSLIYLFSEIFTGREIRNVQSGIGSVFNPGGSVRRLEQNLRFSDTFANRVALADAYLNTGNTDRAIELYESSLSGNFTENEYVLSQLIIAYYHKKRYADIIPIGKKVYKLPQFARSRSHILYAAALGLNGDHELAEKEFRTMKGRFANYEARYYYALFLAGADRVPEARQLLNEMLSEVTHLSSRERRYNANWLRAAKDQLNKLNDQVAAR
ncbi:MAG: hypothetical protein ACHQFX_15445 [Chitinophagales bacterium]